jgi:hypothetical protein
VAAAEEAWAEADRLLRGIPETEIERVQTGLAKSESEMKLYSHQSGDVGDDVRQVDTIVSVGALMELLKAAADMAASAAAGEDGEEGEEAEEGEEEGDGKGPGAAAKPAKPPARKSAADIALETQAHTLVSGENGRATAWNVLDGIASDALGAISGAGSAGGAAEAESNGGKLKLFSTVLQALASDAEAEVEAGRGDREVPASLPVLRTLYATIATCMQVLTGDGYKEAMQASAKASTMRDEAADEFVPEAARDAVVVRTIGVDERVAHRIDGRGRARGDDGDARPALDVGDLCDGQAFDIITAPRKQADDAGEYARLIINQHGKRMALVISLASGRGIGREGCDGVHCRVFL